VCAKVPEAQVITQGILNNRGSRRGEQHLSAVAGLFNPRGADDVQPRIPFHRPNGFPGTHPDAHPENLTRRPGLKGQGTLDVLRGGDRLGGLGGHHEERVALGIDFPAVIGHERGSQQGVVGGQHDRILLSQAERERSAVLDVGVEHREGATRQLRHGYAPPRLLRALAASASPVRHAAITMRRGLLIDEQVIVPS
jgi:hypothetical protein